MGCCLMGNGAYSNERINEPVDLIMLCFSFIFHLLIFLFKEKETLRYNDVPTVMHCDYKHDLK